MKKSKQQKKLFRFYYFTVSYKSIKGGVELMFNYLEVKNRCKGSFCFVVNNFKMNLIFGGLQDEKKLSSKGELFHVIPAVNRTGFDKLWI